MNKNAEEPSEISAEIPSKEVEKCEENDDLVAGEEKSIENNK